MVIGNEWKRERIDECNQGQIGDGDDSAMQCFWPLLCHSPVLLTTQAPPSPPFLSSKPHSTDESWLVAAAAIWREERFRFDSHALSRPNCEDGFPLPALAFMLY